MLIERKDKIEVRCYLFLFLLFPARPMFFERLFNVFFSDNNWRYNPTLRFFLVKTRKKLHQFIIFSQNFSKCSLIFACVYFNTSFFVELCSRYKFYHVFLIGNEGCPKVISVYRISEEFLKIVIYVQFHKSAVIF